ncbi:hypothetical protein [Microcoleus sp. herbarium14]|uniref:hypothetical protein n=1 Tax=Microcoleus sp. herbarium14 TaxID=3055439 RepID=UPI002FD23298
MISTQQLDASGCDLYRSQQNPDLFIGDIVPGYQSFMPYLLETKNQKPAISKNFALPLSAFQTQQHSAAESGILTDAVAHSLVSPENVSL